MTSGERASAPRPRRGRPARTPAALRPALAWLGRHVRGLRTALGLYLLAGLGLALAALAGFAELAEHVMEGATQRFDEAVLLWMDTHSSPRLTTLALEVTALGSIAAVGLVLFLASVLFWTMGRRYSVLLLWVAVVGGVALNYALKALFSRPRPQLFEWRVPHAGASSFPSGHAMTAAVVYGTLAYLLTRLALGRGARIGVWLVLLGVVLLVGASRLYLGVHYPSDVVAGFGAGFAWAAVCAVGLEVVRYFRARR